MLTQQTVHEQFLDLLAHPATESVIILLAAIIGVGGSAFLYAMRRQDQADALRGAIYTELQENYILKEWTEETDELPIIGPVNTSIYENNASSIGLLSDREREVIVEFYTQADALNRQINQHWNIVVQTDTQRLADNQRDRRKAKLMSQLDDLAEKRKEAIAILMYVPRD